MKVKTHRHKILVKLASLLLLVLATIPSEAQEMATNTAQPRFSIEDFRILKNDVSAFITPIRDLNDEACALIKVVAPSDFAFSSPLGIVKRKDEVGEIWLYLPKGTKSITLKHPQWGVLRDYRFAKPLESRMTYELKVSIPMPATIESHDTIVLTQTIIDTIQVERKKPHVPLASHLLLTTALHQDGPSWGLMITVLKRHGVFLHGSHNLGSLEDTEMACDKKGNIIHPSGFNDGATPYYTGKTKHRSYTITTGAIHRLSTRFLLFEGIGYGKKSITWQLAESEGGGYVLNEGLSHKGIAAEIGMLLNIKRICFSTSAITIAGKEWQANIGIGIRLGKTNKTSH